MIPTLLLLATLTQIAAGPVSTNPSPLQAVPGDPLTPDTVFTVPGGPRIVRLQMPGSPLVALRVSIRVDETPAEAGAGQLLQTLGVERARARAGQLAAAVEGIRTPWGIAYTVVGTLPDFDFLAYLLREAVAEPDASEVEFERARLFLRSQALRAQETAAGWMVGTLRSRAAPSMPPLEGTLGSLSIMSRATLRDLWLRSHAAPLLTVVVAGDVPDELVLSAFQDLGAPSGARTSPQAVPAPRSDPQRTQVLRHWYGEAYATADPLDPHPPVAALLLSERLRGAESSFEAQVQLWELSGQQVIAVVGAAYPAGRERMRSRIRAGLADTRQSLSADLVRGAVARVRQELLLDARSPGGLVTVVGRHMDASGSPDAARRFLDELSSVTLDSAQRFLAALERQTALRAELRP